MTMRSLTALPSFALLCFALLQAGCLSPPAEYNGGGGSSSSTGGDGAGGGGGEGGALPGFGAPCTPDLQCEADLVCSSDASGFTITRLFAVPVCVTYCDRPASFCGPSSRGICLSRGEGEDPVGLCVRSCQHTAASSACPAGTECQMRINQEIGFCVTSCNQYDGCDGNEAAFPFCQADGYCYPDAVEPDPVGACEPDSTCTCYPNAQDGTCAKECHADGDCPVQSDTGIQMICPGPSEAVIPTVGFCAVPCEVTADCAPIGLECSDDVVASRTLVCN